MKAIQTASLAKIGSVNRLSWLENSAFFEALGGSISTSPSTGCTSSLRGGRTAPEKPGHPYAAESVRRVFGALAPLPDCKTVSSFFESGKPTWQNMYPSSRPRALHRSSSLLHFAMVGVLRQSRMLGTSAVPYNASITLNQE